MKNVEVSNVIDPISAKDGAGVKLKEALVLNQIILIPLMLDEFGSENKDDYIAGFLLTSQRN